MTDLIKTLIMNFSNENNFLKTSESFLALKPIIN
jgi:hypothetical protein